MSTAIGQVKSFKDLQVWQEAMTLVEEVYHLCSNLPRDEVYTLGNQIKQAAVSIPASIAEGHAQRHRAEYRQSIFFSIGSLAELETQLLICLRLNFFTQEEAAGVLALLDRLKARLATLGRRLS